MAATQEDVDRYTAAVSSLNQAIADGVRQVTIGGQTVTYNTTDSLIKARDDQQALLAAARAELAAPAAPRSRVMYLSMQRGY